MSLAKEILEDLVSDIAFADHIYQVDSEPKPDGKGGFYLDIDTDDGDTYRLSLVLA